MHHGNTSVWVSAKVYTTCMRVVPCNTDLAVIAHECDAMPWVAGARTKVTLFNTHGGLVLGSYLYVCGL